MSDFLKNYKYTPLQDDLPDKLHNRAVDEMYGGDKELGNLLHQAATEIDRLRSVEAQGKNVAKYARQVLIKVREAAPEAYIPVIDLFLAQVK